MEPQARKMPNLKDFQANTANFQRPCLFDVTCEELPKLSFLANAFTWIPGQHLELSVAEEEGLPVYDMLKELREKAYDLKLNFYARDGSKVRTIAVTPMSRGITFSTSMDWSISNAIMTWKVKIELA